MKMTHQEQSVKDYYSFGCRREEGREKTRSATKEEDTENDARNFGLRNQVDINELEWEPLRMSGILKTNFFLPHLNLFVTLLILGYLVKHLLWINHLSLTNASLVILRRINFEVACRGRNGRTEA
ncbi:hypothetical protein LOAG_04797 [Loa loa]|uniref:Uncharacterized protein n=1 Tax=Loa loa TaxID=7209 RepID=A0A1S0U1E4_LOALO|nr:hypothetical protein LOAG_04797 [Loa loa]EFO23685.1 hypothetical protein LOAG_04797 [Loa loa]